MDALHVFQNKFVLNVIEISSYKMEVVSKYVVKDTI